VNDIPFLNAIQIGIALLKIGDTVTFMAEPLSAVGLGEES
jgi:hypothetical protein